MPGSKEAQIFESFDDKDYRDAFVQEHIGAGLARQIRAIREKKGWTQKEFAQRTGKAQETISQWENLDYGRFTLKTLKTLAAAFDLALMVKFASFTELIKSVSNQSPETIAPPSYDDEKQLSFADIHGSAGQWNYFEAKTGIKTDKTLNMEAYLDAFRKALDTQPTFMVPGINPTSDLPFTESAKAEAKKESHEFANAA